MAAKSDKNTHLEHLEDDIINLGYKGAQQSIAFVEALFGLFQGGSNRKLNITVKWDGALLWCVAKTQTQECFLWLPNMVPLPKT